MGTSTIGLWTWHSLSELTSLVHAIRVVLSRGLQEKHLIPRMEGIWRPELSEPKLSVVHCWFFCNCRVDIAVITRDFCAVTWVLSHSSPIYVACLCSPVLYLFQAWCKCAFFQASIFSGFVWVIPILKRHSSSFQLGIYQMENRWQSFLT